MITTLIAGIAKYLDRQLEYASILTHICASHGCYPASCTSLTLINHHKHIDYIYWYTVLQYLNLYIFVMQVLIKNIFRFFYLMQIKSW